MARKVLMNPPFEETITKEELLKLADEYYKYYGRPPHRLSFRAYFQVIGEEDHPVRQIGVNVYNRFKEELRELRLQGMIND